MDENQAWKGALDDMIKGMSSGEKLKMVLWSVAVVTVRATPGDSFAALGEDVVREINTLQEQAAIVIRTVARRANRG